MILFALGALADVNRVRDLPEDGDVFILRIWHGREARL